MRSSAPAPAGVPAAAVASVADDPLSKLLASAEASGKPLRQLVDAKWGVYVDARAEMLGPTPEFDADGDEVPAEGLDLSQG